MLHSRQGAEMPNGEIRPFTARFVKQLLEWAAGCVKVVVPEVSTYDHNDQEFGLAQ